MNKFFGNNLDFFGFFASMLCAVHCAAVPIILVFGTLGSFAWLANHEVEVGFITLSFVLAYWSLWTSFKKHHNSRKAIKVVLVGFTFLLGSRFVPHWIGDILVVIGGLIVAYAHYLNWRLLQRCKHCSHKIKVAEIETKASHKCVSNDERISLPTRVGYLHLSASGSLGLKGFLNLLGKV